MWKGQSALTKKNRGIDKKPSIVNKKPIRKKYRKLFLKSFQKTQTSGSIFAERIEQVNEIKNELHLFKIDDSVLDIYGSYSNNLVNSENKSSCAHHFCKSKNRKKSELVA